MNSDAAAKIAMLKSSVRCFAFGLLGFLPFIGLPFAVAALLIAGQVRKREKRYWNAARPYRIWGQICVGIAFVLWVVAAGLIVYHAATGSWNSDNSNYNYSD